MSGGPAQRVLVVQRRMVHYRVPFFEALRRRIEERGWRLVLAHGHGTAEEVAKGDEGEIPWAVRLPTRYLAGGRICWQPFAQAMPEANVVVLTAENKLILNLRTQLFDTRVRLALWGHGGNLQGEPNSRRERFKRMMARRADWWLAYTEYSRPLIEETGFPPERVTVLNNAVDTQEMTRLRGQVTVESQAALRQQIGLQGTSVGIFLGSLYAEKRVDFMMAAADAIKRRHPAFEWLIVGAGPQQEQVAEFCRSRPWAHYLGMLKGRDKVEALSLARLMLNPGLVGLGVLDSFVCGVPMFTTDCGLHSPEIVYLEDGVNGVMTANELEAYVERVVAALESQALQDELAAGCRASAAEYTVDNMARRFTDGVLGCALAPMRRFAR